MTSIDVDEKFTPVGVVDLFELLVVKTELLVHLFCLSLSDFLCRRHWWSFWTRLCIHGIAQWIKTYVKQTKRGREREIRYLCTPKHLIENKMTDIPKCPKCGSEFTYFDGFIYVCPDCTHEFNLNDEQEEAADVARDSNGAELFDGDAVTVIKDLKVKGSSMVIKRGTKVRSIRLTENPEEVDCKIEGSSIVLKTCFLKK